MSCPWIKLTFYRVDPGYMTKVSFIMVGNTYTFRFQNKSITLNSCRPKELLSSPSPKPSPTSSSPMSSYTLPPSKGTISLLQYKPFEKLQNFNKFYLIVFTGRHLLTALPFFTRLRVTRLPRGLQLTLRTNLESLLMFLPRSFLVSSLPFEYTICY